MNFLTDRYRLILNQLVRAVKSSWEATVTSGCSSRGNLWGMQIDARQIDEKPKKVGELRGQPIMHLRTKGGLHVLVKANGEVLGTGPHRAVARHIAQKYAPDIIWSELSKSDHVSIESFTFSLPKYEMMTDELRILQAQTGVENKSHR